MVVGQVSIVFVGACTDRARGWWEQQPLAVEAESKRCCDHRSHCVVILVCTERSEVAKEYDMFGRLLGISALMPSPYQIWRIFRMQTMNSVQNIIWHKCEDQRDLEWENLDQHGTYFVRSAWNLDWYVDYQSILILITFAVALLMLSWFAQSPNVLKLCVFLSSIF